MRSLRYRLANTASAVLLTFAAETTAVKVATAAAPAPSPPPAPAAAPAASALFDSANLLLFSVELDGLTLTEGLACYGSTTDPLIPMGELTRLLEADVDVSPAQGRVTGRLGEARRSLLIDMPSHTARVGAEEIPLGDQDVVVGASDIYVRLSALQKLLPLKAKVDGQALLLSLTAQERFPVEERLARLANRPDASRGSVAQEPPLVVATPYALFSPPGADVVLDAGARSTGPHLPLHYDVRVAGDLLYSDFQGYLASDENGQPASARAMLQRRSLTGDLLGPLRARELDLGDVFSPALPLGPAAAGGRGFAFTTVPFDQASVFNRVDLRGELPPGYDVELYINDILKGSTNQASNGLYEFLDVPLTPGVNVVRVVTYGPRGERSETVRVINVGAGLLHRGEATFTFGAVQQNETLFHIGSPATPAEGAKPSQLVSGQPRVVGELNYGLTELATVTAGAALTPQATGDKLAVYNLGLRTSVLGMATQVDVAHDSRGGDAAAAGVAGSYRGVSAVLRHAEYRGGFVDENTAGSSTSIPIERRTELTVDTNLGLRGRIIPFSLRVLRNAYVNGGRDLSATTRVSTSAAGVLFSTGLDYEREASPDGDASDKLSGYLSASTFRSYAWQLRATLDYLLVPDFQPRLLTLALDHPISDSWSLHFAVGEPLDNLSGVNVGLSAVNQTRFGDLVFAGEYDNAQHSWRLATEWNFGLGYNPIRRRYQLERSGPGSGGSMLLDAFVDENGDGVRQPGEPAVSKVQIDGGGKTKLMTGPDGTLLVTGMGPGPTGSAHVNLEAIDNPSVAAPPANIQFTPRPGSVTRVAYPLRPTGDVGVKIELLRDDGQAVGLSATRVQLVPERGGAPFEGVTEFDGSVVFNQLPAGGYKIRLDPQQAAQLRMHMLNEISVTIKSDGSFTNDAVVQVKFDPPPDVAPAQPATG